jgi:hypothetical protein
MQGAFLLPLGAKRVEIGGILESTRGCFADGTEGGAIDVDFLDTGKVSLQERNPS